MFSLAARLFARTVRQHVSEFLGANAFPFGAAGSAPALELATAGAPSGFSVPSLVGSDLSNVWFAVPKTKISHSRKRKRTFDRTPARVTHYTMCAKCGKPKLSHKLCDDIVLCASTHAVILPQEQLATK